MGALGGRLVCLGPGTALPLIVMKQCFVCQTNYSIIKNISLLKIYYTICQFLFRVSIYLLHEKHLSKIHMFIESLISVKYFPDI